MSLYINMLKMTKKIIPMSSHPLIFILAGWLTVAHQHEGTCVPEQHLQGKEVLSLALLFVALLGMFLAQVVVV